MLLINKLHVIRLKLLKYREHRILFTYNRLKNSISELSIFPRTFLEFIQTDTPINIGD